MDDATLDATAANIQRISRLLTAGAVVSPARIELLADRPTGERSLAWTELREAIVIERALHQAQFLAGRGVPLPHLDATSNYRNGSGLLRIAAFLDAELDAYCRSNGIRPSRSDLKHRIDALGHVLTNTVELHEVRRRRNDVAHSVATEVSAADVDRFVNDVHLALSALGDYGQQLDLTAGGESVSVRSDGRTEDGHEIVDEREIRLHVRNADEPHLTVIWTLTFFD